MKARVVKAFLYADQGIHVREVPVGAVIEDDCAVQAVAGGWATEFAEGEEKARPALETRAHERAPRNKGR